MTALDDPVGSGDWEERGPDVDPYRDLTLVGRGGTSRVFRAVDPEGAAVAVKVFDVRDESHYHRQVGAAERLGRLAGILDVGVHGRLPDGRCYIVTEFADGGSLSDQLHVAGALSPHRTARIGATVARSLGKIHRAGLLHRDIKPSNLLLVDAANDDGGDDGGERHEVVLSDLGAATLSEPETASGTLSITVTYTAPEILEGAEATERSDIYSLGVALQTLVTGRHPFGDSDDEGLATVINRICSGGLPDPAGSGVPAGLAAVLCRAGAVDPDDRFASADQLADALDAVAADPDSIPPGLGATGRGASRPTRRHRIAVAALAATALVGAGLFGVVQLTGADGLPRTATGKVVAAANGVMTPMRFQKPNIFTSDLTRLCTAGASGESWVAISLHANAADDTAGMKVPWKIINDGFGAFTAWLPCEVNDSQLRYLLFAPGLWFLTVVKFPAAQYDRIRADYNKNPPEYTLDPDMVETLKHPAAYAGYESLSYQFG